LLLLSLDYLPRTRPSPAVLPLVLFSTSGMMLLASANLIVVFLAIELMLSSTSRPGFSGLVASSEAS
jgi:NADH:ubiquinone oxidoreductase subunit 2 (subunit N)